MSVPRCPEIQEARDKSPEELFGDWRGLKREPRVRLDKIAKSICKPPKNSRDRKQLRIMNEQTWSRSPGFDSPVELKRQRVCYSANPWVLWAGRPDTEAVIIELVDGLQSQGKKLLEE